MHTMYYSTIVYDIPITTKLFLPLTTDQFIITNTSSITLYTYYNTYHNVYIHDASIELKNTSRSSK